MKIAAIVVTYNRLDFLKKNIESLVAQSLKLDAIYIIDNASTDNTYNYVQELTQTYSFIVNHRLAKNIGCAGGFKYALQKCIEDGYDWFWLMDDDCVADKKCLEKQVQSISKENIFSMPLVLAIEDKITPVWNQKAIYKSDKILIEVLIAQFNGVLISKKIVKDIGFPDENFFIYADDVEYSLRLKKHGGKVLLNKEAIMYHPYKFQDIGRNKLKIPYYELSKLRIYYATRNNIIIKKQYGFSNGRSFYIHIKFIIKLLLNLKFKLVILKIQGMIDGYLGRVYVKDIN